MFRKHAVHDAKAEVRSTTRLGVYLAANVKGRNLLGPMPLATYEKILVSHAVPEDLARTADVYLLTDLRRSVKVKYGLVVASRTSAMLLPYSVDGTYWLFSDSIYTTKERLTPQDATALLVEFESKRNARIARAHALMNQSAAMHDRRREPITDEVKVFVWQRDQGRCVLCGSNQNLEFDHIIPVSMGGSNSARNLQLLCEPCNRAKSGSLV